MGIFSKFQIKDFKTKILGGKGKHKGEVPSIAVSPPTPSVHDDFAFPPGHGNTTDSDGEFDLSSKKSSQGTLSRQRSVSLPDVFEEETDAPKDSKSEIVKSYLKPPKSRRKRHKRKRKTISCPDILSELDVAADAGAKDCENTSCATGPSENTSGYYGSESGDINVPVLPQLESEEKEFGEIEHTIKNNTIDPSASCVNDIGLDNEIFRHDSIGSTLSSHNGESHSLTASPSAEEFKPLCIDCDEQSEKSETFSNTYLNQKIQRRIFSKSERRNPDARWSLDLDKLGTGCSDNSLLSEEGDMKWDGSKSAQEAKSLASTWSLDLGKEQKIDLNMGRAYSDINFSGSPNLRGGSRSPFGEKVMFNAKSLDLEFVKVDTDNIKEDSDSTLEQHTHKRGINDYVGKFNGIVSKFSTWSLDIEVARKRSLEKELDGRARTQSDVALGAFKGESDKQERALSYHSLLYDFDEASRYQIYQPTVYEIADETQTQATDRGVVQNQKLGAYGHSMKFLSKQFESLYENGKSLYKQGHVFIDAIKQREKELKAIADKEAKAKQEADPEVHKFFKPKPKPPPRRRSTSHRKHVHKVNITPLKIEGT